MAKRPTYVPRFIESAEAIIKRMAGNIPDDYHKEPGDFIYDAMKTNPAEIMQLEENQDRILRNAFPQYCDDEVLDSHLQPRGTTRTPATHAVRVLSVTADSGVRIPQGYTLTSVVLDGNGNPIQYAVKSETVFTDNATTQDVYIICHQEGIIGNIPTGSEFVLQPPIPGIRSIKDLGLSIAGAEKESADEYWTRYLENFGNTDTGGNVDDYRRWVLNDFPKETGIVIQKTIVVPCYKGRGTVQIAVVGGDYGPLSNSALAKLQEWIDPIEYQGLGYGKAPGGAAVDACTATEKEIDITVNVSLMPYTDKDSIRKAFQEAVTEYLQSLVFEVDPDTKQLYPVGYNKIAAFLGALEGVVNFSDLTVNGGTSDVMLEFFEVPTLGTVILND